MAAKHEPTDEQRAHVQQWASYGIAQDEIARSIGITKPTLEKHYRDELDMGAANANAEVVAALLANAKSGNVTAQIWWTKCRMGWKETIKTENETTVNVVDGAKEQLSSLLGLDSPAIASRATSSGNSTTH